MRRPAEKSRKNVTQDHNAREKMKYRNLNVSKALARL